MTSNPHRISCRVYYEDTDAGGIMYHASYLKFAERGRTEYLRAIGRDHADLRRQHSLIFAVTDMQIAFKSPAKLDDMTAVETVVTDVSGARLQMQQKVFLPDGVIAAQLVVDLAGLHAETHRPLRLPENLREQFLSMIKKNKE